MKDNFILKPVAKIIGILLLIVGLGLTQFGNTGAWLFSSLTAEDNPVETGVLDLTVRSGQTNFVPGAEDLSPGDSVARDIYVGKTLASFPLKHRVSYQFTGGDADFCNQLQLKIWYDHYHCDPSLGYTCRDMRLKYNGSLVSLNQLDDTDFIIPHSDDEFDTDPSNGTEQWFFYQIFIPSDLDEAYQNSTCQFNFVYQGYQQDSDGSWGFTDEETLSNTIGSTNWACEEGSCWLNNVEDYSQGTRKDGSPVLPERSDPEDVLGVDDSPQPVVNFYSLGKDGWIIASFEYPVMNITGDDLSVYEVTWGNRFSYPEEKARVEVSQNGTLWYDLGEATNHVTNGINSFDLTSVGLSWIRYVRLTDTTDYGSHTNNSDGFDLDAVRGNLHSCEQQQEEPGSPPSQPTEEIVVNEVYYDVGGDKGSEGANEWVEFYNKSTSPIDITGWKLCDNNSCDVIPSSSPIPVNGFAVITAQSSTWSFWSIPMGTIQVVLGGNIGNGLSNDNERLVLRKADDSEVDAVSWETDTYAFNPAVIDVSEGHSISRNPVGVDTNTAADWIDNSTPNPGTNPHSHIQVNLKQENNNLLISFSNATGFDLVRYSVSYKHMFEGQTVEELIQGEKSKNVDEENLELDPIYIGTCSGEGLVCVPHQDISEGQVFLMYKNGQEILGTSTLDFEWENK